MQITQQTFRKVAEALFLVALLSLAVSLPAVWGPATKVAGLSVSTFHNLALVMLALPLALIYGVGPFYKNPVLIAVAIIFVLSFTVALRHPAVTPMQSVQSFFSLTLGASLFEICKPKRLRKAMLDVLPYIALLSVGIGVVFHIVGWFGVYRLDFTGAYRLQGAVGPTHLAMLGLVGIYISSLGDRTPRYRMFLYLLNYSLIVFSGTRGVLIVATAALPVLLVARYQGENKLPSLKPALATLLLAMALSNLVYLPEHYERWNYTHSADAELFAGEDAEGDSASQRRRRLATDLAETVNTSGRLAAWRFFYDEAKEEIVFGRGIGAGVVANQGQVPAFGTPHNEYLRLLIDGGLVGLILVVMAYGLIALQLMKYHEVWMKISILAIFGSFAALSVLDNTLSSQHFNLLLWMYVSLAYIGYRPRFVLTGHWPFVQSQRKPLLLEAQPSLYQPERGTDET